MASPSAHLCAVTQFPESLEERAKLLGDVQVKDIASIYRMQNVLGAGAQATVYQAVNKKSNRKVAVKVRGGAVINLRV